MNVTNIHSRTVKTYILTIEDGELRDQPHTRTGRKYRVSRMKVVKRDGNFESLELIGYVVKKDGQEGQNSARESFYTSATWPEWTRSIVGGLA